MSLKAFAGLVLLVLAVSNCHASLVGWLLGRDNSPFEILNTDKDFDKLLTRADQVAASSSHGQKEDRNGEHSIQATSDIPFELSLADEKFIADAQKYTDLSLSELDKCQHRVWTSIFCLSFYLSLD